MSFDIDVADSRSLNVISILILMLFAIKDLRRVVIGSTLLIYTTETSTPATLARPVLNPVACSSLKSSIAMGIETDIAIVTSEGFGGGRGGGLYGISTHGPPFGPSKPCLQTHASFEILETGDSVCSGHSEHASDPLTSVYVPVGQTLQSPGGPYCPLLHSSRQAPMLLLPAGDMVLSGQDWQLSEVELSPVEYFPAGQFKQGPVPAVALYWPASHLTHPPLMSSGMYPALQSRGSTGVGVEKNVVVLEDRRADAEVVGAGVELDVGASDELDVVGSGVVGASEEDVMPAVVVVIELVMGQVASVTKREMETT